MEKQEIVEAKKVGVLDLRAADIERLKDVPVILDKIYRNVLKDGTDYGKIPGTAKPSLWKPGAELLAGWLKITPDSRTVKQEEDYDKPFFNYIIETRLYDQNGLYIGNGFGSCNSKEPQYAFRWVYESDIPRGMEKEKLPRRSDGKYRIDATANELAGMANAILKKAKKRSFVDAILTVTGASRIFTQDIGEDREEAEHHEAQEVKRGTPSPAKPPEQKPLGKIPQFVDTTSPEPESKPTPVKGHLSENKMGALESPERTPQSRSCTGNQAANITTMCRAYKNKFGYDPTKDIVEKNGVAYLQALTFEQAEKAIEWLEKLLR